MVGGNVHISCDVPIQINLPAVGEGWYKLDVENYLAENGVT